VTRTLDLKVVGVGEGLAEEAAPLLDELADGRAGVGAGDLEDLVAASAAREERTAHCQDVLVVLVVDEEVRPDQRVLLVDVADHMAVLAQDDVHALQEAAIDRQDEGAAHALAAVRPDQLQHLLAGVVGDRQLKWAKSAQHLAQAKVALCVGRGSNEMLGKLGLVIDGARWLACADVRSMTK